MCKRIKCCAAYSRIGICRLAIVRPRRDKCGPEVFAKCNFELQFVRRQVESQSESAYSGVKEGALIRNAEARDVTYRASILAKLRNSFMSLASAEAWF